MNFSKLVPSVFYIDISDGLKLFVDCLQFSIEYQDLKTLQPYCVLGKDGIRIMVFQDEQLAKEHYPELRIETNNIEEVYLKVSESYPHLLHPNLNKVTTRPWGAKEFAIKDNQIGIRFQQW
jgi:predicted HAD superfamily hydrolase